MSMLCAIVLMPGAISSVEFFLGRICVVVGMSYAIVMRVSSIAMLGVFTA